MEEYPELKYRDIKEKETTSFWAGLLLGAAIASVMWMFYTNQVIGSLLDL